MKDLDFYNWLRRTKREISLKVGQSLAALRHPSAEDFYNIRIDGSESCSVYEVDEGEGDVCLLVVDAKDWNYVWVEIDDLDKLCNEDSLKELRKKHEFDEAFYPAEGVKEDRPIEQTKVTTIGGGLWS